MSFLERLQNLSENKKKIILLSTILILGFLLFLWYFHQAKLILEKKAKKSSLLKDLKIESLKSKIEKTMKKIGPSVQELETFQKAFLNLEKELKSETSSQKIYEKRK